jgi:hypothetical protein
VFEIEPSTNCRRQRLLRILRAAELHMLPHMLAYTRTAWVEWTVCFVWLCSLVRES